MAAKPLLIYDLPKLIQFAQVIINFTILAWYVLHNKETLYYIKHALYKLEKIKKTFQQYGLLTPSYIHQSLTILSFMQSATLFSIFRILVIQ